MTIYMVDLMQCPACACRFTAWNPASCNTFHARHYTDGFVEGPMFDHGPQLLACPQCKGYLWRAELPTLESVRDWKYFKDDNLRGHPAAMEVRDAGYEEALRQAPWHDDAQEKYLRLRAWWSFNRGYRGKIDGYTDPAEMRELLCSDSPTADAYDIETLLEILRRHNEAAYRTFARTHLTLDMKPPRDLPPDQTANLERLIELLDPDREDETLMRAEALRELGRFSECLQVLDRGFAGRLARAAGQIRRLALEKKRRVELLE